MNANKLTVNELLEDEEERPKTSNAGRVHSTDTEAEAEAEAESEQRQEKFSGSWRIADLMQSSNISL